ncbi:cytochrome P450 [Kovacikia minuta CCNUW1]|uniref:cytochrome P450 n=1 Tax=Kovacikia minuta TaxID=2931930 RepID=UPI001CCB3519|nr:cytochrome P450 [Kovacikia minuta CCNUW1]
MKTPNPVKAPSLVQQVWWVADPISYMENAAHHSPDIFQTKVVGSGEPFIFVNQPEAIQQILTNDRKQFAAPGELNTILSPLLGDSSVILLNGDRHRRRRQLLMPPFHGERMRDYGQLILDLTNRSLQPNPDWADLLCPTGNAGDFTSGHSGSRLWIKGRGTPPATQTVSCVNGRNVSLPSSLQPAFL